MYKFFEDRHIKVSLFIQDKIQGLDGTIYLDFCDVGPQHSIKPGQIKFYTAGNTEPARTKQINFMHSDRWQPYPVENPPTNRMIKATRPHLGGNIYAAER